VDQLFDSVNGSTIEAQMGKLFRCAVSGTSPHVAFWTEAKAVLRSIKFVRDGQEFVPPTIKNWLKTVDGFLELWSRLQKVGFTFLITRNLNQDALENFFGCIRSHGVRNVNPTCTSFRTSFKSLIINNFVSPHSPGANCEEDVSMGALDSLKTFISPNVDDPYGMERLFPIQEISEDEFQFGIVTNEVTIELEHYLSGYICKRILRSIGVCKTCRTILLSPDDCVEHSLINIRDYGQRSLLRPRTKFATLFNLCYQVAHYYLVKCATKKNIKATLLSFVRGKIHLTYPQCPKHDYLNLFYKNFCNLFIFTYIKNVNDILTGKNCKNINDDIKRQALKRHNKFRKQKFALRKEKQLI
jgi:hypothetical protein